MVGTNYIHPKRVRTVAQDWPRLVDPAKIKTPKPVLHASTPNILLKDQRLPISSRISICLLTVIEKFSQRATLFRSSSKQTLANVDR